MKLLFKNRSLYVDIGSAHIKILDGSFCLGKLNIHDHALIPTPKNSFKNGYIMNADLICDRIKEFITYKNLKINNISFVIHSSDILIRNISTPVMNKNKLNETVEWEISQFIKSTLKDYCLSYEFEKENRKMYKILCIVVPKAIINQYESIGKILKLKVKYIDIASKCLLRLYKKVDPEFVVIDFGNESTRLSIYSNNRIFADREIFCEADDYYEIMHNEYAAASEEPLSEKRILNNKNMIKQYEQMLRYYFSLNSKGIIENIFFIGGNQSNSKYIDDINTAYNLSANKMNLTERLNINSDDGFKNDIIFYINALGLLIRK